MQHAIATHGLSFGYGERSLLNNISFTAAAGEITAILGANGAGKSTLLRLLLGLTSPKAGEVRINGIAFSDLSARQRAAMGYVPEHAALYDELNALENVAYFLSIQPALGTVHMPIVRDALKRVDLPASAWTQRAQTYSKGMRQKLMIAAALARANSAQLELLTDEKFPAIMLLDEPGSGLDPHASHALDQLLQQLAGEGIAIVVVTHDLLSIGALDAKRWFLQAGQIRRLDHADFSGPRALYGTGNDARAAN
jgi:ABC-2 type transport system ATP-binding protein